MASAAGGAATKSSTSAIVAADEPPAAAAAATASAAAVAADEGMAGGSGTVGNTADGARTKRKLVKGTPLNEQVKKCEERWVSDTLKVASGEVGPHEVSLVGIGDEPHRFATLVAYFEASHYDWKNVDWCSAETVRMCWWHGVHCCAVAEQCWPSGTTWRLVSVWRGTLHKVGAQTNSPCIERNYCYLSLCPQ